MIKVLKNVEEGSNPDIIEARNSIPEPSRTLKVLITVRERKEVIKSDIIYVVNWPPKEFTFRKALVNVGSTQFFVWICDKDGKMYL